jgi:hypothetical protein
MRFFHDTQPLQHPWATKAWNMDHEFRGLPNVRDLCVKTLAISTAAMITIIELKVFLI